MIRLAILFGVSGAGKGEIAKEVARQLPTTHAIVGDHIHEEVAKLLGHHAPTDWIWSSTIGEQFASMPKATDLFAHAIRERHPIPAGCKQVLAEGDFLSYPRWRTAFLGGISAICGVSEAKCFWIDPDPERLMANLGIRARPQDACRTAAGEAHHILGYRRRLSNFDCLRSSSIDYVADQIVQFFGDG